MVGEALRIKVWLRHWYKLAMLWLVHRVSLRAMRHVASTIAQPSLYPPWKTLHRPTQTLPQVMQTRAPPRQLQTLFGNRESVLESEFAHWAAHHTKRADHYTTGRPCGLVPRARMQHRSGARLEILKDR